MFASRGYGRGVSPPGGGGFFRRHYGEFCIGADTFVFFYERPGLYQADLRFVSGLALSFDLSDTLGWRFSFALWRLLRGTRQRVEHRRNIVSV